MGKVKTKKKNEALRMKIQGWIGEKDGQTATLQVCDKPREYIAIERFKKGIDAEEKPIYFYIETPYNPKITEGQKALNEYLSEFRRYHGTESTAKKYHSGLPKDQGKGNSGYRTARELHEYSSELCGDMHRKSLGQIRKTMRRAESLEQEFIKSLSPAPPRPQKNSPS